MRDKIYPRKTKTDLQGIHQTEIKAYKTATLKHMKS